MRMIRAVASFALSGCAWLAGNNITEYEIAYSIDEGFYRVESRAMRKLAEAQNIRDGLAVVETFGEDFVIRNGRMSYPDAYDSGLLLAADKDGNREITCEEAEHALLQACEEYAGK